MVELTLTRGATGRKAAVASPGHGDAEAVWGAVSTLAARKALDPKARQGWDDKALRIHQARSALLREIGQAGSRPVEGDFWRARTALELPKDGKRPADFFHEAPGNPQQDGRFHDFTEECMYLGHTREHLAAEMAQGGLSGSFAVGRFHVEEPTGRYLSLLPRDLTHFPALNWLAMDAERNRTNALAAGQSDPYVGTQWLRHLIEGEGLGLDGVLYPTVQGPFSKDTNAWNLAVFSKAGREAFRRRATPEFEVFDIKVSWSKTLESSPGPR